MRTRALALLLLRLDPRAVFLNVPHSSAWNVFRERSARADLPFLAAQGYVDSVCARILAHLRSLCSRTRSNMLALVTAATAFMSPLAPATSSVRSLSKVIMGGKGFGGGEATRDPTPTVCAHRSRSHSVQLLIRHVTSLQPRCLALRTRAVPSDRDPNNKS